MAGILVVGGLGVIGSWVTRELVENGHEVVVYQRHADNFLVHDIARKFQYIKGDITELPNIVDTIKRYDLKRIIHMASVAHGITEKNPLKGFQINAVGTMNILEAARLNDIERVVFISSKSVYDIARGKYAHPTYAPIDEGYPKDPRTVYGSIKLFLEHMGLNYHRIYGVDFVALRFGTTWGPGKQRSHPGISVQSKMIESVMLGKGFEIQQGGDQVDDMIYHRDAAHGIVLACFADKLKHRIFHLGTGTGVTLRDMVPILAKIKKNEIKIGPGLDYLGFGPLYGVFDISRAKKEMGYSPQYDLARGIDDYVQTMKRMNIEPTL